MEYWPTVLGFITLLLIQTDISSGGAIVNVKVLNFTNPFNRGYDLTCCDKPCSDACDNIFELCFDDSYMESPELFCSELSNETFYSDTTLPDVQYKVSEWTGGLTVKLFVYDLDNGTYETVDYVIIRYNSSAQSDVITQPGGRPYFKTSFTISISYTCDKNYYGPMCDEWCEPQDDVMGHYKCDNITGEKVCLTGWNGTDCANPTVPCKGTVPSLVPIGSCQAIDMLFVLDSSKSVNDIDPTNWQNLKTFLKAFVDRVTLGPASFKIGVIVVGNMAEYSIKLSASYDPDTLKGLIDALEYEGKKTNMRAGLKLARTDGFLTDNGGRPEAYRSVVVAYDGGPLSPEFGTWANEAPRLREMGVDVSVVSLDYYFKRGMSQRTFVEAVASEPWVTHLWTDISDWTKLSSTVAPTILASVQDACQRKGRETGGGSTSAAASSMSQSATTIPPSTSGAATSPASISGSATTSSSSSVPVPVLKCSYRGFCSEEAEMASCYCMKGYAGPHCQYEADPCSPNPCKWGECKKSSGGGFTCSCLPGFSGDKCDVIGAPISCDSDPCAGGGSGPGCVATTPNPQCSALPEPPCSEYFYGDQCETFCAPRDSCSSGHYTCGLDGKKVCNSGWKNESSSCTDSDGGPTACGSLTCMNGGVCFNEACCCKKGFTGEDCSVTGRATTVVPTGGTGTTASGSMGTGTTPSMASGSMATSNMTGMSTGSMATSNVTGMSTGSMATSNMTGMSTGSMATSNMTGMSTGSMATSNMTGMSTGSMATSNVTGMSTVSMTTSNVTGMTGGSMITSNMTTGSMVTSNMTTMTTGAMTTKDPQQELLEYLEDFFRQNFPYLTPIQKQQLLNFLLSNYDNSGSPAFADFTVNSQPLYVSDPFPGTGQLRGSSIRLEVLKAVISRVGGSYQLSMTYDYIVTDPQGQVTRITPENFAILSQDGNAIDTSLLNSANKQELKLYGTYLDQSQGIQIAEALKEAYGEVNSEWAAKTNRRVAIDGLVESVGQNGEKMTMVGFWLVSGSVSPYMEETSVTQPQDSTLQNLLTQRLASPPGAIISHVTAYRLTDCFGLFVRGDVYTLDLAKFSGALEKYWQQKMTSDVDVTVLTREIYFLSDGSRATKLLYIIHDGATLMLPTDSKGPTDEDLQSFIVFRASGGSAYQVLNASMSSTALPVKNLFSVVIKERADPSVFSIIEQRLQQGIREISGYSESVVTVISTAEFVSVEKRMTYSKILFSIHNKGKLLDSHSDGTEFRSMWYLRILLGDVTLPNGHTLTYVIEDLSRDSELSRDSCFYVDVSGTMQDWRAFEKDLQITLSLLEKSWTENKVTAKIAFLEQYINASGDSVTRVFYSIFETTENNYQFWIDERHFSSDIIPASSIADRIMISHGAGSGSKILVIPGTTLERYLDSFGTFYSKRLVTTLSNNDLLVLPDISAVINHVGSEANGKAVTARIATVEEFFTNTGDSVWRVGYFVYIDGHLVRPESVNTSLLQPSTVSADLVALPATDSQQLNRVLDLFSFTIYPRPSSSDMSSLRDKLSSAMRSTYEEYELATVATKIVAVKELLILSYERSTVFKIYYKMQANSWPVSAYSESPPSSDILDDQLFLLKASNGEAYYLWTENQLTYRTDMVYQLYAYDHVGIDIATDMVAAVKRCWMQYQAVANIETTLRGLKSGFGSLGTPVTIVFYSVEINSQPLYPDVTAAPGLPCLESSLRALPYYNSSQVTSTDTLHRVTFKPALSSSQVKAIQLDLETAWKKQIGEEAHVTVIGAESRVESFQGLEQLTSVYYAVGFTSNVSAILPHEMSLQGGLIKMTDSTVSSVYPDTGTLSLGSLNVHGSQVSGSDVDQIADVLKSTIESSAAVKNVTVKILTNSQTLYTSDDWHLATRIGYVAAASTGSRQNSNAGLYDVIGIKDLSDNLQKKLGLTLPSNSLRRNFRTFTSSDSQSLRSKYEMVNANLTRVWMEANQDLNSEGISVSVHQASMRRKRDNRQMSSPTYQDLNGVFVSSIDYHVAIKGYDPNPYIVQEPTDSSISNAISAAGLVPACLDSCSASLRQCSILYVLGSVTSSQYADFQRVIAAAYAAANAPNLRAQDISVTIRDNDLIQDNQRRDISRLSYCIQLSKGVSINIYDVIVPSYDVMGKETMTIGRATVAEDESTTGPKSKKGLETSVIIIISVVCGFVGLLLAAVATWQLVRYCQRRERLAQDHQKLSIYDSDSFVGHATYNSSPVSSVKRYSPGSVLGKIQFVEGEEP